MNTYTKLNNGDWGVRYMGTPKSGDSMSVTKKDGTVKVETVDNVVWQGKDSRTGVAIALCSIAQRQSTASRSGYATGDRSPHGRTCPMCGSRSCAMAWDPYALCDED